MTVFGQDRTPIENVRDRRNSQRWRIQGLIFQEGSGLAVDSKGRIRVLPMPPRDTTGDDSVTVTDRYIRVDASAAPVTITLAEAETYGEGRELAVKKIDSSFNTVTIERAGVDLLDGGTELVLHHQYQSVRIVAVEGGYDVVGT